MVGVVVVVEVLVVVVVMVVVLVVLAVFVVFVLYRVGEELEEERADGTVVVSGCSEADVSVSCVGERSRDG